jgi:multidrug efflux pump subunit AcrA (membrane-fusion protein)
MTATSEDSGATEEATQRRMWAIARDLAEAARRETSREAFLRTWLSGVLAATSAESGSLVETTVSPSRTIVALGTGVEDEGTAAATARRDRIRRTAVERRECAWAREEPPASARDVAQDRITLIAPLPKSEHFAGVAELAMPAAVSAERQRTSLNFVLQVATFVEDFLLRERVKTLTRRQDLCEEALAFVRAIHARGELQHAAYAIVNEARRLIRCDRVTVLRRRGRRYRVLAISGQDTFDARSPAIKSLIALTNSVAAAGRPLSSDAPCELLPPQLERALSEYVDESHVKHVAVVPLISPPVESAKSDAPRKPESKRPLGALVFERHTAGDAEPGQEERVRFVVEHATSALASALEQEQVFLLPLWRAVGRAKTQLSETSARGKALAVIAAIAALIGSLCFIRTDFALHASATFQPVERRNVFAPLDGTVSTLLVRHGERVAAGQPLILLRNTDLEGQITEARGERTAAAEQLFAVERTLLGDKEQLTPEERVRLSGQRAELTRRLEAMDEKLRLLEYKRERLRISSPLAGEVITWQIERLLRDRPVQQGQVLLTVADTTHAWELEVYLPEHYVGHMVRAQRESSEPLRVKFRPTSDPSHDFVGTIREIDATAEVRGDRGNTVLVTVLIDASEIPQLKPGVEATAKVICGRQSLGYVWLHDLADFLQAKVLFRLY